MNEKFHKDALKATDELSPADLQKGLAAEGIELVSKHSGKILADVPYTDLFVGMRVVWTVMLTEGEIETLHVEENIVEDTKTNLVFIRWDSGTPAYGPQHVFRKVKVK